MISKAQQLIIDYAGLDPVREVDECEACSVCPFCGSKGKEKFYFNKDGFYLCFLCEEKGNLVKFLQDYLHITYSKALSIIKEYHVDKIDTSINTSKSSEGLFDRILDSLNQDASSKGILECPSLPTNTITAKDAYNQYSIYKPFFNYLSKRHISANIWQKNDIRFCLNGTTIVRDKHISLGNSIIFVAHDDLGRPIYWNTRSIASDPYLKTFNASGGNNTYSKRNVVYGLNRVHKNDYVVICESVLNSLMVDGNNYTNLHGLATYGKKITNTQIHNILAKEPKRIYIALDPDAFQESAFLMDTFVSLGYSKKDLYLINYPDTIHDLNDYGVQGTMKLIKQSQPVSSLNVFKERFINLIQSKG